MEKELKTSRNFKCGETLYQAIRDAAIRKGYENTSHYIRNSMDDANKID